MDDNVVSMGFGFDLDFPGPVGSAKMKSAKNFARRYVLSPTPVQFYTSKA